MKLRLLRRAPILLAVPIALTAAGSPAAAAEEPVPVIDSAPSVVRYDRSATIQGHLRNGDPGMRVRLERKGPLSSTWHILKRKEVNDRLRVRFNLYGLRKTAEYRLTRKNPRLDSVTESGPVRIWVRPRLTLRVRPNDVLRDRTVVLSGRLEPAVPGRRVALRWKVQGEWRWIGRPGAGDGTYRKSFSPGRVGRRKVRVKFRGDDINAHAREVRRLWIYKRSMATWYGPGFFGNRTACGQILRKDTLGVAHRHLPCGNKVSILYRRRKITVPVIDRGPYGEANWDLTAATARRLNFEGRDHIGVIR